MSGMPYEELAVGQIIPHATTRTVTEADNTLFTCMTMNPQPLHLDAEFAGASEFGRRLVNSLFTLGLVVGLSVPELTLGTTIANLGFERIDFPKPVFHGDTIRAESEIVALRESRSRPDAGLMTVDHRGINQRGEVVCLARRVALMRRRP
ncbi:MaoC family dehydratase [Streptosporangium sp. NPDC004631]